MLKRPSPRCVQRDGPSPAGITAGACSAITGRTRTDGGAPNVSEPGPDQKPPPPPPPPPPPHPHPRRRRRGGRRPPPDLLLLLVAALVLVGGAGILPDLPATGPRPPVGAAPDLGIGSPPRPRVVGLRPMHRPPSRGRYVVSSRRDLMGQDRLRDEENPDWREDRSDGGCEPLRPWQGASFPTCNAVHEIDRTERAWASGSFWERNKGGLNSVFGVEAFDGVGTSRFVMKQIQIWLIAYRTILEHVRMDGLVMERLSSSPFVMDLYGFCGQSLVVPMASHQLGREIFDREVPLSGEEKLRKAVHASSALADIENIDGDGVSPYVNLDYMVRQYMVVNGALKLNDFNKGRWVTKNRTTGDLCTFASYGTDGTHNSPEVYRGEPLTSKTQVFSLGNVLQSILTGRRVWDPERIDDDVARGKIARGIRDEIPGSVRNSTDPIDVTLKTSVDMCFVYRPRDRPSGTEVARFLREAAERLGVDVTVREVKQ